MDNRQREMIHTLMNQHSKPMVQAAYRRIGDWHLAEDLVQETFLTACWKAIKYALTQIQLRGYTRH